jgi:hypothetical protein
MTTTSATAAPVKKRVRRATGATKRATPLKVSNSNLRKATRAAGAKAWMVGRTLFSIARIAVGGLLVVAAAAAAASLVPRSTQRQLAGNVRDIALLAVDRARSLAA